MRCDLGVELSQLFVLVLLVPLLDLLYRHVVPERMGIILLSAIVAHTSWHWMSERATTLGQYAATWPFLSAMPTAALPWIAPIVILAVVAWRLVRTQERPAAGRAAFGSGRQLDASLGKNREGLDLEQPIGHD